MADHTLYWHDYETFGTDPRRDRPVQFAGIRTDLDFNCIDDPLILYCRPPPDYLPQPEACLVTGITPQLAQARGVCEAEFIRAIHEQLARPNTCTLGYNSLRFDDEVTRNTLYRNFYDPYQREWQNGNSRWDLIDVLRAARALRPDGIEWPIDSEGVPVFRLEALTQANAIAHQSAHDALSDVYATIALARLVKSVQPRLYQFLFEHRVKSAASKLLQLGRFVPVVHVSGKYPARKQCLAVVLPICQHPTNSNGIVVYDLSVDPEALVSLSVEAIKQRIFTLSALLPEGAERIPLKTVHVNKCPVLAPISVLREADADRLEIDLLQCYKHLERIKTEPALADKIMSVFRTDFEDSVTDPDLMIYSGGFFSPHDKAEMARIRDMKPQELANLHPDFHDKRLPEMWFRYKGRNYPESLDGAERRQWVRHCKETLCRDDDGAGMTFSQFFQRLETLKQHYPENNSVLRDLQTFAEDKKRHFTID
ncbi:MAG: exodeoxyribonuclease I [Gammaproteobacteria bacterium]